MNQNLCISLIASGAGTFLLSLGEFISSHDSWSSLTTTSEVGHLLVLVGSFLVTIYGSLNYQMKEK